VKAAQSAVRYDPEVPGNCESGEAYTPEIAVEPEFVVRQSTARAPALSSQQDRIPTTIQVGG